LTTATSTIDDSAFREAMSRLGASVHVLTTDGPAGACGITASAVCSVSDDPPTLLVCLNRASPMNQVLKKNGVLCVNTLTADQRDLAEAFAGKTEMAMAQRFKLAEWSNPFSGAPTLEGARVAIDCRITEISEVATHSVVIAQVQHVRVGPDAPALMYLDRTYRSL
jgi:flavin reductase